MRIFCGNCKHFMCRIKFVFHENYKKYGELKVG